MCEVAAACYVHGFLAAVAKVTQLKVQSIITRKACGGNSVMESTCGKNSSHLCNRRQRPERKQGEKGSQTIKYLKASPLFQVSPRPREELFTLTQ